MFESLTDKLGSALRNLRGVGKLTEENMADALKEVRTALLAADVHFKVARDFVERVQTSASARRSSSPSPRASRSSRSSTTSS
jgi:signal recognition particle subunit SRP54